MSLALVSTVTADNDWPQLIPPDEIRWWWEDRGIYPTSRRAEICEELIYNPEEVKQQKERESLIQDEVREWSIYFETEPQESLCAKAGLNPDLENDVVKSKHIYERKEINSALKLHAILTEVTATPSGCYITSFRIVQEEAFESCRERFPDVDSCDAIEIVKTSLDRRVFRRYLDSYKNTASQAEPFTAVWGFDSWIRIETNTPLPAMMWKETVIDGDGQSHTQHICEDGAFDMKRHWELYSHATQSTGLMGIGEWQPEIPDILPIPPHWKGRRSFFDYFFDHYEPIPNLICTERIFERTHIFLPGWGYVSVETLDDFYYDEIREHPSFRLSSFTMWDRTECFTKSLSCLCTTSVLRS